MSRSGCGLAPGVTPYCRWIEMDLFKSYRDFQYVSARRTQCVGAVSQYSLQWYPMIAVPSWAVVPHLYGKHRLHIRDLLKVCFLENNLEIFGNFGDEVRCIMPSNFTLWRVISMACRDWVGCINLHGLDCIRPYQAQAPDIEHCTLAGSSYAGATFKGAWNLLF